MSTRRADLRAAQAGAQPGESNEVRDQILAATERLLETQSAADLNVAQILTEAGVSRATFYYYYASKYAVITELAQRAMDEIYTVIQPFLADAQSEPREAVLRRSLKAGWEAWKDHSHALGAMIEHWHEVPELGESWRGVIGRFATAFAGEIDRERAEGLAPPGVPSEQLAAALLWSTAQCMYVAGLGDDKQLAGPDEIFETILAIWVGAIYGRPTG